MINVNVSYKMAANSLIDPATKQFYPDLVPGGGGGGGTLTGIAAGAGLTVTGAAPVPQINLGFSATVGEIMVGTGVNTGAPLAPGANGDVLTIVGGVPVYAAVGQSPYTAQGQIQYAGVALADTNLNIGAAKQVLAVNAGATAPEWVNVGGSGTVTATLPLVESAAGAASNIAINFTTKGDLPVGTGGATAGLGTILSAGDKDYVLTSNPISATGLAWVAPSSTGGPLIIRNNNVSAPIAAPTTTDQQLLLVAGTIAESWDTIPSLQLTTPYIATATITTANGNQYVALQNRFTTPSEDYAIASLHQVFPAPATPAAGWLASFTYDLVQDSGLYCIINGMKEISPNVVVLFGAFGFADVKGPPQSVIDNCNGLIRFDATTNLFSPFSTVMLGISYSPLDIETTAGYVTDVQVHNGKMFVCGRFNSVVNADGSLTLGYGCILQFPDLLPTTLPLLPAAAGNLGIVLDPAGDGSGDQVINCMHFVVGSPVDFIQEIALGGKFTQCGLAGSIDPVTFNGYALYDYVNIAYTGIDPPSPVLGPPGTVVINSWNISLSAGAAGVAGSLLLVSGVITDFAAYIEFGAGVVFPITLVGITGAGYLNSVKGGNIVPVVADPAAIGDVILFTQATTLEMVCYFIPAQAPLAPLPGIPVLLPAVNKIYASPPDSSTGGLNPFGIVLDPFTNPAPAINEIYVAQNGVGDIADQILVYNAAVRSDITFIPTPPCKFVQGATEYTSATFIAASSQYFISNADRTRWIISGGLVSGATLNP